MKRILEIEIMSDINQCLAYSKGDFSDSNGKFIDYITGSVSKPSNVLDIGTGPGDVAIELSNIYPASEFLAIDGSAAMIEIAKSKMSNHKFNNIQFVECNLYDLELKNKFDLVLSKDTLHHIVAPISFINKIISLCSKGSRVLIMDLIRPKTVLECKKIVDEFNLDPILKKDFMHSLYAGFEINEVSELLTSFSLKFNTIRIGVRHFLCDITI